MTILPFRRSPGLFLCGLAILATLGSAADHRVKVEAFARAATAGHLTSYWIHSGNPAVAETSLRFAEAARHIQTALSAHGLFEARDEAAADLIVMIDFGLRKAPPRFEQITLPVRAGDPDLPAFNALDPRGRMIRAVDFDTVVAYEEFNLPVDSYEKFLDFSATENKPAAEGRPPATLWRVAASLQDDSTDVRAFLPLLAAVVMESIGHETNGPVLVRIADRSPAIAFIKKGLPAER